MNEATQALNKMTAKISDVAGREIEITVRGLRAFTFSFDGRDDVASAKLAAFFASEAKVVCEYDEECDQTCIFIDA